MRIRGSRRPLGIITTGNDPSREPAQWRFRRESFHQSQKATPLSSISAVHHCMARPHHPPHRHGRTPGPGHGQILDLSCACRESLSRESRLGTWLTCRSLAGSSAESVQKGQHSHGQGLRVGFGNSLVMDQMAVLQTTNESSMPTLASDEEPNRRETDPPRCFSGTQATIHPKILQAFARQRG